MTISETQLTTWSNQGATVSASALYQRVKTAVEGAPEFLGKDVRVYLQGSYRNSTNTRGDSDVDVIVELGDAFMSNASALPSAQYQLHQMGMDAAVYQLSDLRRDLLGIVRRTFPNHAITEGGKSIKIPRTLANIPADIVPCCSYRDYQAYFGERHPLTVYEEGVWLFDVRKMQGTVGFPKQHYKNGAAKNADTGDWFKPSVRLFKNIRCVLEEQRVIQQGSVTSNNIECLIYNLPSACFGTSLQSTFVESVNWLNQADLSNAVCVHGQRRLFRRDGWTVEKAKAFVGHMADLWNGWGRNARVRF